MPDNLTAAEARALAALDYTLSSTIAIVAEFTHVGYSVTRIALNGLVAKGQAKVARDTTFAAQARYTRIEQASNAQHPAYA